MFGTLVQRWRRAGLNTWLFVQSSIPLEVVLNKLLVHHSGQKLVVAARSLLLATCAFQLAVDKSQETH
jgi:hypothetical protein